MPGPARSTGQPQASATGASADPENPRDLAGAPVVLTGTVRREGGCVILDVGSRRWVLTGAAARKLVDGQQVTVRGRPVTVPAGCDATLALALRGTPGR